LLVLTKKLKVLGSFVLVDITFTPLDLDNC
jgi:hypothetical protein